MEIGELLTTFGGVIVAMGGWKAIEVMVFRKSKAATMRAEASEAEAEARQAKIKADEARFDLIVKQLNLSEERNIRLQEELTAKEERFAEQTAILRTTNRELRDKEAELLAATRTIGERDSTIAELLAERKMKLCERQGCGERLPQSGY